MSDTSARGSGTAETDYQRIIKEVLACDPISACKRADDQLEPPWEVIARVRKERDAARAALRSCEWKSDDDGVYWTTCGNGFTFIDAASSSAYASFASSLVLLLLRRQAAAARRAAERGMKQMKRKPKMTPHIWVVEMFNDSRGRFEPTIGAALTREDALSKREEWRAANPFDKFTVARYVRRLP